MSETVPGAPLSPLEPRAPRAAGAPCAWGRLHGSGTSLALAAAARRHPGPLLLVTADMPSAERYERELRFFGAAPDSPPVLAFPDRETLPYDVFSPHQDIVSERLATLYRLPGLARGIIIAPVATLMARLPPRAYLEAHSLMLDVGETVALARLVERLETGGYRRVAQVMEHGEYSVRGGLVDLYPMGSRLPYRIDLLGDEIDGIRTFDPETQRSVEHVERIRLLPAREFPLTEESITRFRQGFRARFAGDPQRSPVYRDVSNALAPAGVEYYLPLFFEHTATLLDYLPPAALIVLDEDPGAAAARFWDEAQERYEERRHDSERPLLAPAALFLAPQELAAALAARPCCAVRRDAVEEGPHACNYATRAAPPLSLPPRTPQPLQLLAEFLSSFAGRVLLVAESAGRREALLALLHDAGRAPALIPDWPAFLANDAPLGIAVAPLDRGVIVDDPPLALITESQIFGEHAMQRRRRKRRERDAEAVVRSLTELQAGAPVVHEEHGIGRYLGLETLTVGGLTTEFLKLEYAGGDKLYVPVASLHLIARYTGASPEQAPLHRLGSGQWQRARRRAAERVRDVAAELLELYARRAARQGHAFPPPDEQYAAFAAAFPFEETPDQEEAIRSVIADMASGRPMDRLICGDVGFGKTEVAMRAAFLAVHGGRQVAVLVPTTLLAQQHYRNFQDRFADLPVRIEILSRFRSARQQEEALAALAAGRADIVIGTHKLLRSDLRFQRLGLVIIDEEHRFGVRQKERLKALRAQVDVLALTATPIPRTLNMALSSLRDLSIIATPPLRRLAIKTFVREWSAPLLREACLREIRRGGQVYFLHNEVRTIERIARQLAELVPEADLRIAHGQMPERELERIMLDFYHQRFNVLVCSTIIESGIDVPNANTIVIHRADKLGLAQIYQLRGRVGRSHHQAYAYLIVPPRAAMTEDAARRLEAVESITDLGTGFALATHDLEIRGAGELLGEEQSGQIQEIGFSMYTELLERAVTSLRAGREPELETALHPDAEIDLGVPALIPEDYLPDVHARLILYKRIAGAAQRQDLDELQVEMIDRFGLLPEPARNLFRAAELKLAALELGIRKIEAARDGVRIGFGPRPRIDADRLIGMIQAQPQTYRLNGTDRVLIKIEDLALGARLEAIQRLLESIAPEPGPGPHAPS